VFTAGRNMILAVVACLCCLSVVGTAPLNGPPAGAEESATASSGCVNATTSPTGLPGGSTLPGASTVAVVDTCQSSAGPITGGEKIPRAAFAEPTKAGDLLVAAVLCGVLTGGMAVPTLTLPPGWHKGAKHTGGIQGGLEATIYYQADNPGGVTSVALGREPAGNNDVWCTTFTWEISGAGASASVDAKGFASVVGGTSITVATSAATTSGHDLVLAAETDGSEYPPNQYQVSHGFDLVSVWPNGKEYQPGTFSALVTDRLHVERTTISQASAQWFDSTAVIVALNV
jgi:hypothetical protein